MTNKVEPIEKPAVPEKKGVQQTPAESALHENTIQPLEYTAPSIRWDAKQVLSRPSEGSLGVYNSVQRTPLTPAATIPSAATTHHIAAQGVQGQGHRLPHLPQVERSFGQDLSHLRAYTDSTAKDSCRSIGARAYATGHKIAFSESNPSLHTVSHEAAHAALQSSDATRTLKDGIGQTGDKFERHADAVAEKVVQGQSLGSLLTQFSLGGETQSQTTQKLTDDTDNQPVQKSTESRTSSGKPVVQMQNEPFEGDRGHFTDAADGTVYPGPTAPTFGPAKPHTGACSDAHIVTAGEDFSEHADSAPDPLKHFYDYSIDLLEDPSVKWRAQRLTTMHALNHHLNPGQLNHPDARHNMFLGTAASNGNHSGLVEEPIKNFIRTYGVNSASAASTEKPGWVDYSVTPDYGALPPYIQVRADTYDPSSAAPSKKTRRVAIDDDGDAKIADEVDFQTWAANACPQQFRASATYYKPSPDGSRYQTYTEIHDYTTYETNYAPGVWATLNRRRANTRQAQDADPDFTPNAAEIRYHLYDGGNTQIRQAIKQEFWDLSQEEEHKALTAAEFLTEYIFQNWGAQGAPVSEYINSRHGLEAIEKLNFYRDARAKKKKRPLS